VLAGNADSPIGLWYSGSVMMGKAETATAGFARMRRALNLGLERRMSVDASLAEHIRSTPANGT
tara:strand:- start:1497 stop:1688 length:192 start_codon:yes stop_codon:yes gene_type:complete